MALPAPLDLKEWFDAKVEAFLLVAPTSTSPQPVHVLNGLFHNSLSGRRSPRAAVDLVATKQGRWDRTAAQVREKTPITLPRDDHDLARLRRAVSGLVASDRAVFRTNHSFQLAHLGLISSDTTHFKLGQLGSQLLFRKQRGNATLSRAVSRLAEPQPNAQWAIEAILAEPAATADWDVEATPVANSWLDDPTCASLADDLSAYLERVLTLVGGQCDTLLALQTLASSATWCGLLTFAQVSSLKARGSLLPLLCEAGSPGALPTLRTASASSLSDVNSAFDEFLRTKLLEEITSLFENREPTREEAHAFLQSCKPYALSGGSAKTHKMLPEIFDVWHSDGRSALEAVANSLQDGLTASMGDKPRKWFSAVGRHCGFVGPRRGHPARFRAEVALIPSLVIAGLSAEDGPSVPFAMWLERLADRFGVFFGPHDVCRRMVPRASEDELEANAAELASLLASLGLARRYSDGVTEVLNPLVIWQS